MLTLFLLPFTRIADDPLDLLLHSLHRTLSSATFHLPEAQANPTARTEFQDGFGRIDTHTIVQQPTIHLRVEVIGKRILSDQLRNLDPRDEVLVRLSHQIVVSRLFVSRSV